MYINCLFPLHQLQYIKQLIGVLMHIYSFPLQISASNHKKKLSIAPEVHLLRDLPSQATDIYSYGVLLQELAATQRPCLGEVEWEIYLARKEKLTTYEQEYDENTPKKFIKV